MTEEIKGKNIKERVFKLASRLLQYGYTKRNDKCYQKLDTHITELALAAAKKVEKRKYGYTQSNILLHHGRMVILYKMILDYKSRRVPPTSTLLRRATTLKVPLAQFEQITCREITKEVQRCKTELWEVQKRCDAEQVEWLENEVKARAKAAGNEN